MFNAQLDAELFAYRHAGNYSWDISDTFQWLSKILMHEPIEASDEWQTKKEWQELQSEQAQHIVVLFGQFWNAMDHYNTMEAAVILQSIQMRYSYYGDLLRRQLTERRTRRRTLPPDSQ